MNIFILSDDPIQSAKMQCDKHIVKMILESAQMLSTAHQILDNAGDPYYKMAYINHPCTKWTRKTSGNYMWHYTHWLALCKEYTYRYGKVHLSQKKLQYALAKMPKNIRHAGRTKFACCMPNEYKVGDVVTNYRLFYANKPFKLQWTNRQQPDWIDRYKLNETLCKKSFTLS